MDVVFYWEQVVRVQQYYLIGMDGLCLPFVLLNICVLSVEGVVS